jgi:hypothetical protein
LIKGVLSKFFIGDEPIFNINYISDDLVNVHVFERRQGNVDRITSVVPLSELISILEGLQAGLEVALKLCGFNREQLMAQVADDISAGVFGVYLNGAV